MSYSQLEEELLDVFKALGPCTSLELRAALGWSTARLHPILAQLKEFGAIKEYTPDTYPRTTQYSLIK